MNFDKRIKELKKLNAYELVSQTDIPEIAAVGVSMCHKKTGARIYLLLSDDNNKVFYIGFRTPSKDSTGVAHIIEHTVLCGSKKYPSKDPFVELVKGSLNTFLNAMTYPDKTVYPVASCNTKDFNNLCDVYMDAVFNPNIYKEDKIFKQEGWHYELTDRNGELTYNGVVYNEMKGVYSSSDGIIERGIGKTLFEGHPYGEESGGDPDNIPELSYEDYLSFHKSYYHPSNSYIYLYGDVDMAERLSYLDKEYLSKYERLDIDSSIPDVTKWDNVREASFDYPVSEEESTKKAAYLSIHTLVGGECDPVMCAAFQVLDYVLLDAPGAYLREALIDAGIGEDILGGYQYGISEPYFSVIAKNASSDQRAEFLSVVNGVLYKLSDMGLDKEALRAAINVGEFRAREADFGSYPKGLIYGLECLNTWLYDGDPSTNLRFQSIYDKLKSLVDEGYFEKLIKNYLLDNTCKAIISFNPVKGLASDREEKLKKKLLDIKNSLSDVELDNIIKETNELKKYQSEPSSKEDLAKIPMLSREDIDAEPEKLIYEKTSCNDQPMLYHDIFTSKIAYMQLLFRIDSLSKEELPYIALLKEILGYADTKKHSYAQLNTNINLHTGGIGFSLDNYENCNTHEYAFVIAANAKTLYSEISWALECMAEILLTTKLSDTARIKDILLEVKAKVKEKLLAAGHITASTRSGSHDDKGKYFEDATKGIEFYKFLEYMSDNYDAKKDELSKRLIDIAQKIFTEDNMLYNLTCDSEGRECFEKAAKDYGKNYPLTAKRGEGYSFVPDTLSEGFETASQVSYVARTGDISKHGYSYTGELQILKVLLSYDYLWNKIRVLGGAYGCFAQFTRNGKVAFSSYRDPNVAATDRIYDEVVGYIESYDADEREMTKSIIGAISALDTPLTPYLRGVKGTSAYFNGVTDVDMLLERKSILKAEPKDIRELAPMIKAALSDDQRCVVGNKSKIEEASNIYTKIEALYKG